jgi:hypothetical protein
MRARMQFLAMPSNCVIALLLIASITFATAALLLPQEALSHAGESASVRGLVEQVSFSRGNAFLNFGGRYPRQAFTGFVRAGDIDTVGGEAFLRSLLGNPITITGKIELFKGRPEIVISSPAQLEK